MGIRISARYQWEDTNSPPFFDKTFVGPRITIGNDPSASLCLNGSILSAEQIVIIDEDTEPQLINQAEGTSLNGELLGLNASRKLRNGDVLCIGTYTINIFLEKTLTSRDNPDSKSDVTSVSPRNGDSSAALAHDTLEDLSPAPENQFPGSLLTDAEEMVQPDARPRPAPAKSFAAILDSLRTDEDRFYFVIEGGPQSGLRIPIELEEMPMGWTAAGELCFEISSIADLCAIVRKDWSGVILQGQIAAEVVVNEEPLAEERRLRDGDRLLLRPPGKGATPGSQLVLVFREPTSLVILDSLMPRVPTPQEDVTALADITPGGSASRDHGPTQKLAALIKSDKEYFTVFTFVELLLMGVGTLVGAFIIFLILNYS